MDFPIPTFDNINASNPGINFGRLAGLQNPSTSASTTGADWVNHDFTF